MPPTRVLASSRRIAARSGSGAVRDFHRNWARRSRCSWQGSGPRKRFMSYARRRRGIPAMDGGSIPPISTIVTIALLSALVMPVPGGHGLRLPCRVSGPDGRIQSVTERKTEPIGERHPATASPAFGCALRVCRRHWLDRKRKTEQKAADEFPIRGCSAYLLSDLGPVRGRDVAASPQAISHDLCARLALHIGEECGGIEHVHSDAAAFRRSSRSSATRSTPAN